MDLLLKITANPWNVRWAEQRIPPLDDKSKKPCLNQSTVPDVVHYLIRKWKSRIGFG